MSHIVTIKTEIRDTHALRAACDRLHLPPPVNGTHQLFSGQVVGAGVQLPEWRYPVVCDLQAGRVHYDNFHQRWGRQEHLNRLLQAYAVERARIEARRQGHSMTEQPLQDGSIRLTIQIAS